MPKRKHTITTLDRVRMDAAGRHSHDHDHKHEQIKLDEQSLLTTARARYDAAGVTRAIGPIPGQHRQLSAGERAAMIEMIIRFDGIDDEKSLAKKSDIFLSGLFLGAYWRQRAREDNERKDRELDARLDEEARADARSRESVRVVRSHLHEMRQRGAAAIPQPGDAEKTARLDAARRAQDAWKKKDQR